MIPSLKANYAQLVRSLQSGSEKQSRLPYVSNAGKCIFQSAQCHTISKTQYIYLRVKLRHGSQRNPYVFLKHTESYANIDLCLMHKYGRNEYGFCLKSNPPMPSTEPYLIGLISWEEESTMMDPGQSVISQSENFKVEFQKHPSKINFISR